MRIAIDADDTVMSQIDVLLPLLNWHLGTKIEKKDVVWNFFLSTPEMTKAFWGVYDLYDMKKVYLRRAMPPTDSYAFPVIRELQKLGHIVEIVTRNKEASVPHIHDWMWMHGVEIEVRAIQRAKVSIDANGNEKDNTGKKADLPYDIFIDDSPMVVDPIVADPSKTLILYAQPWNRHIDTQAPNVFRADGWLQVREILKALGALK